MSYMTHDDSEPAPTYGDWFGQTEYGPPAAENGSAYWSTDEQQFAYCVHCDSYLYADRESGIFRPDDGLPWDADDTDSEDDEPGDQAMSPEERDSYYGTFTSADTVDRLRHEYLFARRRFRFASNKASRHYRFPRKFHGKGKGKGKSKYGHQHSYGKGKYGSYFGGPLGPGALAGGKGKKGGGGERKPLYDKNGDVMRCWDCGSDQHLSSRCPHKGSGGSGKGKGGSAAGFAGTTLGTTSLAVSSSGPLSGGWYFDEVKHDDTDGWKLTPTIGASLEVASARHHFFTGEEGGPSAMAAYNEAAYNGEDCNEEWEDEQIATALDMPVSEARKAMWMPWWPARDDAAGQQFFNTQTRMRDREGEALLVDPGAHGDLMGSMWLERFGKLCEAAGAPPPIVMDMKKPIEVGGVGAGNQICRTYAQCVLGVDGRSESYAAPIIPNSPTPALLGIKSLRRQRCVIDCFSNKMYTIGPGGYRLQLSPGSQQYDLQLAHSGHLMLPCTDFDTWPHHRSSNAGGDREGEPV